MNTRNSKATCWINTHRVTLCEMEADVSYHADDLHQGRDAQNRVPAFSILAGKPEPSDHDDEACAAFWTVYLLSVALTAFCAVVLAFWPN